MDSRGQGALEYLLIITGALVVAAVVISLLYSTAEPTSNKVNEATENLWGILGI